MAKSSSIRTYTYRSSLIALSCLLITESVLPAFAIAASEPGTKAKISTTRTKKFTQPLQSKGLPRMHPGVAKAPVPKTHGKVFQSQLDEVGNPAIRWDPARYDQLRTQLRANPHGLSASQQRIRLGELDLARQEPETAKEQFTLAVAAAPKGSSEHGLARYDVGVAAFYAGRYERSREIISDLLAGGESGFDRRDAALFLRHVTACAGYHTARRLAGITEPSHLDPMCGAESLAVALRFNHLPYDRQLLTSRVYHTGEGSSMADLLNACPKLGVAGHAFEASDKGLRRLFQKSGSAPVVAHIEHDHFVAVVSANNSGVSYLCSDCGDWPGGKKTLSWKQWDLMEPDAFVAVTIPGTPLDRAMSMLPSSSAKSEHLLVNYPIQKIDLVARTAREIVDALAGGVVSLVNLPSGAVVCGTHPAANHCPDNAQSCPCDGGPDGGGEGPGGGKGSGSGDSSAGTGGKPIPLARAPATMPQGAFSAGPSSGDPVNLATGEEQYAPAPDLQVYNPTGPSVVWSRMYNSLGNSHSCFGQSWSHPYNVGIQEVLNVAIAPTASAQTPNAIVPINPNGLQYGYVVYENTAKVKFTPTQSGPPTAATPHISCTVTPGSPLMVSWDYDSASGKNRYTVTFNGRNKWVSDLPNGGAYNRPIVKMVDRSGNYITLSYSVYAGFFASETRLTNIADSAGISLLTLALDANGYITSATDRYGRSVYYHIGTYACANVPSGWQKSYQEVDQVSQIVPTGTTTPPLRYQYGYQNFSNLEGAETVPFLHTISVPSPTGTGTSTTTISYAPSNAMVSSVVDGNGYTRQYSIVDSLHTKVSYLNPQGQTVYSYIAGFSSNMAETSQSDGNGLVTDTWAYSDANDPNLPSQVTDANGHTTQISHDVYGHITSTTNAYGATTAYQYNYTNFLLGELLSIGTTGHTATSFLYNESAGQISQVSMPTPGTVNAASQVSSSWVFDSLGNPTSVTRPGNSSTGSLTSSASYTVDGTYSKSSAINQPILVTSASGVVTHMRYDARGNRIAEIDALGNETDYAYNLADQLVSVTFPATGQTGTGRGSVATTYLYVGGPPVSSTTYDESGNVARQVITSYGSEGETLSVSGEALSQSCQYDALYRVVTALDGNGHSTSYSYNAAGYLAQVLNADGTSRLFTSYDSLGNVLSATDERGVVTNYVYNDSANHLTDIQYPASTSLNVHRNYDALGRLTGWTDGSGSYTFALDDRGLPTTVTQAYTGAPSQTITISYFPSGKRSSFSTSYGTYSYQYTNDDLLSSETNPAGQSWTWSYLGNDWMWRETQSATNVRTEFTKNARGLPTEIRNYVASGTGQTLSDYSNLQYDGAANLISQTCTIPTSTQLTGTTTYARNTSDELVQEQSQLNGGTTATYAYDSAGNPTTFRSSTATYNSVNESAALTFDAAGNQQSAGGLALTYDAENRLTSAGSVLTAGYRADGQRAWKNGSGGQRFFYYLSGRLIFETDSSGNVLAENTWGARGLLARQTSSYSLLYTFDPEGNLSQQISSSTGTPLASYHTDAYGLVVSTGTPVADAYAGFGALQGYYRDSETGLYQTGLRYYNASQGRFLSRDPSGLDAGVNLYSYCWNDPVGRLDPSGTSWWNIVGDTENFYAKCLNGGVQAIGTLLGDILTGEPVSATNEVCNAAAGCISAMMTISEDVSTGGIGCIVGAIGSLMGNAMAFVCQAAVNKCHPPSFDGCTALNWAVSALAACAGGALGGLGGFGVSLFGNELGGMAQGLCSGKGPKGGGGMVWY